MEISKEQLTTLLQQISCQQWDFTSLSSACEETIIKASNKQIYLTIAVLDKGGQLVFLYRHPKALLVSLELAQKKAYSAYAMKMDTKTLQALTQPGGPLYQLETSTEGKIVSFAGGITLKNHPLFSAIGVSGALDPLDDEAFAKLFYQTLEKSRHEG